MLTLFNPSSIGLHTIVRVRWATALSQGLLCLFAYAVWHVHLPVTLIVGCLFFATVSNAVLSWRIRTGGMAPETHLMVAVLLADTVTLMCMLYYSGGAHNPFTSYFLLHVVMAAIVLPRLAAWGVMIANALAYTVLFRSPHELVMNCHSGCELTYDLHLQGMLGSWLITALCITYFIGKLRSELLRREAALDRARAHLHNHERFANLATLAGGVAHELATPLSTLALIAEDYARKSTQNESAQDAELMQREVQRCKSILSKLSVRWLREGESPDEPRLVNAVLEALPSHLNPSDAIRLNINNELPASVSIAAHEGLIQSLVILIKNAAEADSSQSAILLNAKYEADNTLCFCVSDKGCGIDPATLERISEPFFSTKPHGLGLGLFVVRSYAERMGGRLCMESVKNQGSRFSILLPQAK